MYKLAALLILFAGSAMAQIPTPQVPLTGTPGSAGNFPFLNSGTVNMPADTNLTLTFPNTTGISYTFTSSVSLTAQRSIVWPAGRFTANFCNYTTGSQSLQIIGPSGTGAVIANGTCQWAKFDGTNWVTIGPAGGGGITGSAASGTYAIGASSSAIAPGSISEVSSVTTFAHPVQVSASGASQAAFTYNSTPLVPGSATTAVYGVDSSGFAVGSEAGGSASRFCTAANLACAGSALPSQSVTFAVSAGTFTATCQSGYTCTSLGGMAIINGTWANTDAASINWSTFVPTTSQTCIATQSYLDSATTSYAISSQPPSGTQFQFNFHAAAGSTSNLYIQWACVPK